MRFQHDFVTHDAGTVSWVWDNHTNDFVRDGLGSRVQFDSVGEAIKVETIMNQRVECPELTRADGKLVTV